MTQTDGLEETNHNMKTTPAKMVEESTEDSPESDGSIDKGTKKPGVSLFAGVTTALGIMLGGGVIGIPYAMLTYGIFLCLGIFLLIFIISAFSLDLMFQSKLLTGKSSLSEIGYICLG